MRILLLALLQATLGLVTTPAFAARQSFDPALPCSEFLNSGDAGDQTLVVFWASGFMARASGQPAEITAQHLQTVSSELSAICDQSPLYPLNTIVALYAASKGNPAKPVVQPAPVTVQPSPVIVQPAPVVVPPVVQPAPVVAQPVPVDVPAVVQPAPVVAPPVVSAAPAPPSPRDLLLKFFEPNADRAALTAALKPSADDIHAVYGEPLASNLIQTYDAMFAPGTAIGPKPEHVELYSVLTSTAKLKSRAVAIGAFPGGYKKVLPYLQGDHPIVRFKFVKAGETTGLAFDGLVFVNNHWVLMPKPWRSLE